MESKLDIGTIVTAAGVAAYAAIAVLYLARHELGLSLEEIREAAVTIAVGISVPLFIGFSRTKRGRAK